MSVTSVLLCILYIGRYLKRPYADFIISLSNELAAYYVDYAGKGVHDVFVHYHLRTWSRAVSYRDPLYRHLLELFDSFRASPHCAVHHLPSKYHSQIRNTRKNMVSIFVQNIMFHRRNVSWYNKSVCVLLGLCAHCSADDYLCRIISDVSPWSRLFTGNAQWKVAGNGRGGGGVWSRQKSVRFQT